MLSSRREAYYQIGAAVCGILSTIALLPSVTLAAAGGMLFDAPGSEEKAANYLIFYLLLALPLVLVATIPLAIFCYKKPTNRHAIGLLTPFVSWAIAATLIALII